MYRLALLAMLGVGFRVPVYADSLPAASIESLTRASHLYDKLQETGVLNGTVLTWQGVEYDVSKNYTLCDGYDGICFKGYQAGFNDPVMLAVSEDSAGQLAVQPVDYVKFKKDRSMEAAQFYEKRRILTEDDVYKMKDA